MISVSTYDIPQAGLTRLKLIRRIIIATTPAPATAVTASLSLPATGQWFVLFVPSVCKLSYPKTTGNHPCLRGVRDAGGRYAHESPVRPAVVSFFF